MSANYWASAQHLQWEDPTTDSSVPLYEAYNQEPTHRCVLPDSRLLNWYLQKRKPLGALALSHTAHALNRRHWQLRVEVEPSTDRASNSHGVPSTLLQEERHPRQQPLRRPRDSCLLGKQDRRMPRSH